MEKLRLGGMALQNGVLVHGPRTWGAAVRLPDGTIKAASGPKPRLAIGGSIPLVRGPLRLAEAFAVLPAMKRGLPEARLPFERPVVGVALIAASTGATLARVVLLPDGTGYLRGDDLRELGPDHTYQLWALTGPKGAPVAVSAGVLGPDPTAVGFHASGPVHGFAMTVEHAGGVVRSRQQPIASASLS